MGRVIASQKSARAALLPLLLSYYFDNRGILRAVMTEQFVGLRRYFFLVGQGGGVGRGEALGGSWNLP